MVPSIGRIVHYKMAKHDVESITARGHQGSWHPGNPVEVGDVFPAMIVRTWGSTEGSAVNLQVFLDSNDSYWATSRQEGGGEGNWSAPFVPTVVPPKA